MTFEETLRERIKKAPFPSKERDLLKVVLVRTSRRPQAAR